MATKKPKTKETVILIRIPDVEARRGDASLTIQRGDLGHMQQFSYSGLTLRGNITEALQTALIALAKLETTPPPQFSTSNTSAQANNPFTSYTPPDPPDGDDDSDAPSDDDLDDFADAEDSAHTDAETNPNEATPPPVVNHAADLREIPAAEPERITPAPAPRPRTSGDAVPRSTAQMTLF